MVNVLNSFKKAAIYEFNLQMELKRQREQNVLDYVLYGCQWEPDILFSRQPSLSYKTP